MATFKHISSKNADYGAAEQYLTFEHDEFTMNYAKTGKYTGIGTFTIVEETDGKGASKWGLLKAYQEKRDGWVSLDYAKRV